MMTGAPADLKHRWRYAIAWPIVAIVIGGLSIWQFVNMVRGGRIDAWTVAVGVIGTVVILIVILAIPALRSGRRGQLLHRETPHAFVCTVAVYPEAAQQLDEFAEISGGSTHHLWGNIWAELWCDGNEIRVCGGTLFGFGGRAKILARVPLGHAWTARIERAQQGLYEMNTLQITGSYPEGQAVVNVLPNWSAGVALLPYYRAERMEPFANELRALAKDPL